MLPPGAQVGFKLPLARPLLMAGEVDVASAVVVVLWAGAARVRPRKGRRTRSWGMVNLVDILMRFEMGFGKRF